MEKIGWVDLVKNVELLCGVKEEKNILVQYKEGKLDWSHNA